MTYLLDTDSLIYMVRGLKIAQPRNQAQKERLLRAQRLEKHCRDQAASASVLGVSAITVAELEYGARHSGDYVSEAAAVRKLLVPFVCFDFDCVACAHQYGIVRESLEAAGLVIGAMDLLIAAHALALNAVLVTNNATDFARVPGLQTDNWSR
jgi:tRNA(fMet)-specific endonuclease VapC